MTSLQTRNGSAKTRILFVDDEPLILEILKATVETMSGEREMSFADSGDKALALLEKTPFDVVLSDMRMPGMTGAQLLNEVMKRYPAVVRLILSGYADDEQVMQCVGTTHQFLAKPFELTALIATLDRVRGLRQRLRSPEITKLLVKKASLPSMPSVYLQIVQALQSSDEPVGRIAQIIATDPGLTAKVLQLVNSAFFGFSRQVSDADEAVMLLGLSTIRSLALSARLFSAFESKRLEGCSVEQVWNHSMSVGQMAKKIVQLEGGDEAMAEQSFTAGLLHDVGKLILVENLGPKYVDLLNRARKEQQRLITAEQQGLRATHAEVGAYLLDLWGLPAPLVEAVALHHQPGKTSELKFSALTAVHAANVIEQESQKSDPEEPLDHFDSEYLDQLGLGSRVEVWRKELCEA